MTYDGRADHLLAYFRSEVLAAYQAQPDKFSVSTGLRTRLETAFGVDAAKCRTRQDALRHLRRFEDENLPANYGIHAASGMIGKTVESVRVGEREHTPGIHRSEMIEIHFTDGSVMSLHTGSNANGIRPHAGETYVTPDDFHADFIVEWVPPRPDRKPTDPAG